MRTDSEQYLYPNLEKVRLTIEGVPNSVFSQGLPKSRFFEEAKRFFCPMCEKSMADEFMSIDKFYRDGFALVIDLRSTQDDTTGGGKKIVNTQSGVLLEITKKGKSSCKEKSLRTGALSILRKTLQPICHCTYTTVVLSSKALL